MPPERLRHLLYLRNIIQNLLTRIPHTLTCDDVAKKQRLLNIKALIIVNILIKELLLNGYINVSENLI